LRGLASPTILYIVTLAPLPGQIVLELDLRLSRAILDRLLGGSGQPNPILRDLTEIELTLLKTIRTVLAGCLREAWSGVFAVEPDLREPTLSPEFVQVTLPGESTIRLALEVALLGVSGHVTLCLPHPVLQPVLEDLSAQVRFASGQGRTVEDAPLDPRDELCQVAVPIVVELGRATLSMRELLQLEVGQVIKLDTPATGDLQVRVGEQPKLWGRPGVIGRNLALQVTRVSEL
ncbi:MAG: FliM/FliN family flagellar motor switch protein, partial [Chloroflexi bacterium]|nr:FliM/FliN family flagellar motor switch protein [Chloroflexota bacterium]